MKGQLGLIVLVIVVGPMVLFMIIAGYVFMQVNYHADLNARISGNQEVFKSQMISYQVLNYRDESEKLATYRYSQNKDALKTEIYEDIDQFMGRQGIKYYQVNANYSDGTQLVINNNGATYATTAQEYSDAAGLYNGAQVSTEDSIHFTKTYNLATPSPGEANVTVKVSFW
ncbi:MAG: hypothetical protein ABEJ99_05870 [Candidatus Nanohaloarchaea archaeon]